MALHEDQFTIGPPANEDELRAFCAVFKEALWPPAIPAADMGEWVEREGKENIFVARKVGRVVGGYSVQRMGQWFGGRSVPMGGVRAVCVAAEHRAGGVGSALMRACLEQIHREGLPIATLYPATQEVYRRAGYEKAGVRRKYRVLTKLIDVRDRTLDVRRVEAKDFPVLHEVYGRRARATAGNVDRNPWLWGRILSPPAWIPTVTAYVVERSGRAEGYVVFSVKPGAAFHDNEIEVADVVALSVEAGRRIWALLADHRSVSKWVNWYGPPVDPLLYLLDEQVFEVVEAMDWMVRIVDVPAALEARGYAPGVSGELVLNVRDDVLAHNNGRFVLTVGEGVGRVNKVGHRPVESIATGNRVGKAGSARHPAELPIELSIDVRGLAALYTGHLSAFDLLATGYLDAPSNADADSDTVLRTASAIFSGPAPWMADMF